MIALADPRPDVRTAADIFARAGHVRLTGGIPGADARALHAWLADRRDWRIVMNANDRAYEMDEVAEATLGDEQRATLDRLLVEAARDGFQYRFRTLRVSEDPADRVARGWPVDRLADAWNAPEALGAFRAITGDDGIAFADAQATAYAPGDFLNRHDDAVEGKARIAAYVLSLNPVWNADWGGLLLLHDGDDRARALVPAFNTLDLFRVPQPHSVTPVARWAGARRFAVTGWLRTRD